MDLSACHHTALRSRPLPTTSTAPHSPPRSLFLKARQCRDKPPLVPGSTEKLTNVGQSRADPASFLSRKLTPTPNPGSSLSLTSLALPVARRYVAPKHRKLYPIATHSCKHIAKSFISASDTGGIREAAGLNHPFPFLLGPVNNHLISFRFNSNILRGRFPCPHISYLIEINSMRSSCWTPICVLMYPLWP